MYSVEHPFLSATGVSMLGTAVELSLFLEANEIDCYIPTV